MWEKRHLIKCQISHKNIAIFVGDPTLNLMSVFPHFFAPYKEIIFFSSHKNIVIFWCSLQNYLYFLLPTKISFFFASRKYIICLVETNISVHTLVLGTWVV